MLYIIKHYSAYQHQGFNFSPFRFLAIALLKVQGLENGRQEYTMESLTETIVSLTDNLNDAISELSLSLAGKSA